MSIKKFLAKHLITVHYVTAILSSLYFIFSYLYYTKTNDFLFCMVDYKSSTIVLNIHIFLWFVILMTIVISFIEHEKITKSKKNKISLDLENALEDNLTLSTLFKKDTKS